MIRMRIGLSWFFMGLALISSGCAARSAFLEPLSKPAEPAMAENRVDLEVRPVDTSGFGNKERKRLGIDLSAYFSAFDLTVQNHTRDTVYFEERDASIMLDAETVLPVLSEAESLSYYQTGDLKGGEQVLIPKARAIEQKEMDKIKSLRLRSAEIPATGSIQGILLFRKISKDQCKQASLVIKAIRIAGEDHPREFRFNFGCPGS